jgi:polyribonucleotide nucleotidyltransferase
MKLLRFFENGVRIYFSSQYYKVFRNFNIFLFYFRNSDVEKMQEEMRLLCKHKLQATYSDYSHDKLSRDKAVFKLMHKSIAQLTENYPNLEYSVMNESFTKLCRNLIADSIIDRGIRVDGRKKDDLRNIGCQVKIFLCFYTFKSKLFRAIFGFFLSSCSCSLKKKGKCKKIK